MWVVYSYEIRPQRYKGMRYTDRDCPETATSIQVKRLASYMRLCEGHLFDIVFNGVSIDRIEI